MRGIASAGFAIVLVVLAVGPAVPARAQDGTSNTPVLEVNFEETETVPGQPLTLRLTVYVPTYLPKPPVWPSLEAPNLLVRLPERSTGPVSKSIGGATWAGVSRRYEMSPMVPGSFSLPPQEVVVTYADPETNETVQTQLETEAISFQGVVPKGAEGLDPFLAATGFSLRQDIDGNPDAMKPGDSVTRTVTATIGGTSSMFVPELLPDAVIAGVAAYPAAPVTSDSDERGTLSGVRTESVTYVAEGGCSGEVPAISIDWYSLKSKKVETAMAEGFQVSVDGPPVGSDTPRDWRALAVSGVAALAILGLLAVAAARLMPRLRSHLAVRRAAERASEHHAFRQLQAVIGRRDARALYGALDLWAQRVEGPDPRSRADVAAALAAIGAARYSLNGSADDGGAWRSLFQAVAGARRDGRRRQPAPALPPLNPTAIQEDF